jgi:hypothetical protein
MPLVFVHGVNTRKIVDDDGIHADPNDPYYQAEWMRNCYFREIVLPAVVAGPGATKILSPYWGHLGASMAWGNACLPLEAGEAFGTDASEVYSRILSEMAPDILAPPDQLLLTLARPASPSAPALRRFHASLMPNASAVGGWSAGGSALAAGVRASILASS